MAEAKKPVLKGDKNSIVEITLKKDFGRYKAGKTIKMEYTTAKTILDKFPDLGDAKVTKEVNMTVHNELQDKDRAGLKVEDEQKK